MVIERAHVRAVEKPWGVSDLRPWSGIRADGGPVGELWYECGKDGASDSALLLKVLFTTQPLSIQVHPDDAYAQKMGLPQGKTEAWYILSAAPDAKVAVGLTHRISPAQLRQAIEDGSIADIIQWRKVAEGDVVFIPPGTIHTIGPGIVLAEIQQRSDTTFRMFDYGRTRELHVDDAVAVADAGPAKPQAASRHDTKERTLLVVDPHFIFECVTLPPNSAWHFGPEKETWLFAVSGNARAGTLDISTADCVFLNGESVRVEVGANGLKALVAYPGPAIAENLLCDLTTRATDAPVGARIAPPLPGPVS